MLLDFLCKVHQETQVFKAITVTSRDATILMKHTANIAFDALDFHDSAADAEAHAFSDGKWCFVFHSGSITDSGLRSRIIFYLRSHDQWQGLVNDLHLMVRTVLMLLRSE